MQSVSNKNSRLHSSGLSLLSRSPSAAAFASGSSSTVRASVGRVKNTQSLYPPSSYSNRLRDDRRMESLIESKDKRQSSSSVASRDGGDDKMMEGNGSP